ncbi:hypothetical protein [Kordia sp.]|uniref:hypothetical protein n=1 Tax=Kordia sp. TaxID=1965332 RepID=UPI0025C09473|nr:hypothetical protein [Kordia sp.]MCH2196905.1 hypothetical protein [Kordia sp.]
MISIVIISLFGCNSGVIATFHISNIDMNQVEVPLRLIVNKDTIFDQNAKYTDIRPDLQYTKYAKLTKGMHEIIFEVANTGLKKEENITFDKNKWIFLSYTVDRYKKPN